MLVHRIGHATMLVEAAGVRVLMDPILIEPFEGGTNRFEPAISFDAGALAHACDLVILSHEHGDHFCVPSLDHIDRARPVVYPAACALIERALLALGFRDLRPVVPGETLAFGPLELTFTPSAVVFPEVGVLFSCAGRQVWNCVDTELSDDAFALVRRRAPRLDVMMVPYQVLIEEELGCDGLGSAFPRERYGRALAAVRTVAPRCVVPSACGYRYAIHDWQNQRGFPVTEREFLDDLAVLAPDVAGRSVPHGAAIDAASLDVRDPSLPFVRRHGALDAAAVAWRPDRGVPPLTDEDPHHHGSLSLRAQVERYLARPLLDELDAPHLAAWRRRLAGGGVVWELDVVYPDGSSDVRWLDLAAPRAAWSRQPPRAPKLITSICASTLAGLCSGEVTPYRAVFTRRVVLKLHAPGPDGIEGIGTLADEPIARALFPTANLRNVDWELRRLGVEPEAPRRRHGLPRRR